MMPRQVCFLKSMKKHRNATAERYLITRRQFIIGAAGAMAAASAFGFPSLVASRRRFAKILVLGIDGMDPNLVARFIREGRMPNAARMAERGCFMPLATTHPPQSPVAWSDFISGTNPGGHGIFDFIAREAQTLMPYLSTARTRPPRHTWQIGKFNIPLGKPRTELLRHGPTLWVELHRAGFESRVVRAPVNFPPAETRARTLSGLTTPDVHGSYGVFTFFTTSAARPESDVAGGRIRRMFIRGDRAECVLEGPANTFRAEAEPVTVPFVIERDAQNPVARIRIQDKEFLLREGEWSPWVTLHFPMMALVETTGICRFYLKQVRPECELYVTPINIDPERPAMPISTPANYAPELARSVGKFYTQGMPEDTAALSAGVFNDDEYREQALFVAQENMRLYEHELRRFKTGFFYTYFSALDLNSHAFWRTLDPNHPLYSPELAARHGDFLPQLYEMMDRAIGMASEAADERTWVLAVSDHGFCSFRRQFHLNSWLMDNGYARARDPRERGRDSFFSVTDWTRTRAYGLGINSLYLNLQGREPNGIVEPGEEAEALRRELIERLMALRDPENGEPIFAGVYRPEDLYAGPYVKEAPDLILGYRPNYRASWKTVLGSYPHAWIEDNLDPWSGDHCMDPQFIPGTLLSNVSLKDEKPALQDMAPTIYAAADVPVPAECTGRNLLG